MKVPTPQALGLPEKFDSWRSEQEEALATLITTSFKRSTALDAPTGCGKSAINFAYAKYQYDLTKEATCFVTQNKGLQNQMMEDFSEVGLVDLRGSNNYPCDMDDEFTCEEGYNARCPLKGSVACPRSQAEIRASISPFVVTNYSKWTAGKRFSQGMSHFKTVIFDEAHEAPLQLAKAMQVTLHHHEICDLLALDFPKDWDDLKVWKEWAATAKGEAEDEYYATREKIKTNRQVKASWVKHMTHMQNLVRNLTIIATCNADNWVVEEINDGYVFDPIRPGRYAESMLLLKMPRVIFTSATLHEYHLRSVGFSKEQYVYKSIPSSFDPKDCPIYYIPTQFVDERHPDRSKLWRRFDNIARGRRDRKGLVHTISFARRDEILRSSEFADSMFINERGEPTTKAVDEFKELPDLSGGLFISPSIGAGFDFKGTAAEWQFVMKIPFEPPSKILKAREEDSQGQYRAQRAANILDQAFGRVNRERGDRGESFICDDNLQWFIPRFGHFLSKTFHQRFRPVAQIPKPLAKM